MVKFVFEDSASTIPRLAEWINKDPYHQDSIAENWTGGSPIVACWVHDGRGPVMFLRADAEAGPVKPEGGMVRLHIQFAPADEVSKMRQVRAILEGWPRFLETITIPGVKGVVFQSVSPTLIGFMQRLGFEHVNDNEYLLIVRE